MKRDQYWGKPKKAKVERGAKDAWWYATDRCIELHVRPDLASEHVVVQLPRAALKKYLDKSAR